MNWSNLLGIFLLILAYKLTDKSAITTLTIGLLMFTAFNLMYR